MSHHHKSSFPEALHSTVDHVIDEVGKRNSLTEADSPKHHSGHHHSSKHRSSHGDDLDANESAERLMNHVNGRAHDAVDDLEEKLHARHTAVEKYIEPLEEIEEAGSSAPKHYATQAVVQQAEEFPDEPQEQDAVIEDVDGHDEEPAALRADDEQAATLFAKAEEAARTPEERGGEDVAAPEWRELDDEEPPQVNERDNDANEGDNEDGAVEGELVEDEAAAAAAVSAPYTGNDDDAEEQIEPSHAMALTEQTMPHAAMVESQPRLEGDEFGAPVHEEQADNGVLHAEEEDRREGDAAAKDKDAHQHHHHGKNKESKHQPSEEQAAFEPLKRTGKREHLVHPNVRDRRVARWNAVPFEPRDDSDDEMEFSTCMAPVYEDEEAAAADGSDAKPTEDEYKNGKPRCTGEVTSCFAEPNLLYRIVRDDDKSWAFYNDTRTYEMHVQFIFGKQSKLEPLGKTTLRKQDDGSWLAETIVDPTETEPFVRGRVNGYTSKLHAVPLTDEYHQSCREVADAAVDAEVEAIRRVCDSRNAEVVLRACLINNLPFVDPEFPPTQASLDAGAAKPFKQLAWARPATILPAEMAGQVRLFRARPRAGPTIDAGDLGDSWLLCAIAAIGEEPQRLVDLFRHPNGKAAAQREHALGAYRVTICKHGWWRSILVDDYLPVSAGQIKFAHSARDPAEIWSCIIEKAFAKLHGSYGKIVTGDPLHALTDLTGFTTYRFDDALAARDELASEFFDDLVRAIQSRYTVICSTPSKDAKQLTHVADTYNAAGLVTGHAYTVVDAMLFPDTDTRLIKLRNAWRREVQWTGDWANGDAKWEEYPEIAAACGVVDGRTVDDDDDDDGTATDNVNKEEEIMEEPDSDNKRKSRKSGSSTFWMPWEAVQKYFSGGGVCFSHAPVYDYRMNCAFNDCVPSTVLELDVQTPTWLTFSLSQEDRRCASGDGAVSSEYQPVMVSVATPVDESSETSYRVILNSTVNSSCPSSDKWTFLQARDVSLIHKFEPGKYLIVPRLMAMDGQAQQVPFVLGIISNREVGAGEVAVSFRRLAPDNRVFENFPKFDAELLGCGEVQYQKKLPGTGFPQTQMGHAIE